jgi:hypothetical protein
MPLSMMLPAVTSYNRTISRNSVDLPAETHNKGQQHQHLRCPLSMVAITSQLNMVSFATQAVGIRQRTAAAGPHNGYALPWLCFDVDAIQHLTLWVVAEVDVLRSVTAQRSVTSII